MLKLSITNEYNSSQSYGVHLWVFPDNLPTIFMSICYRINNFQTWTLSQYHVTAWTLFSIKVITCWLMMGVASSGTPLWWHAAAGLSPLWRGQTEVVALQGWCPHWEGTLLRHYPAKPAWAGSSLRVKSNLWLVNLRGCLLPGWALIASHLPVAFPEHFLSLAACWRTWLGLSLLKPVMPRKWNPVGWPWRQRWVIMEAHSWLVGDWPGRRPGWGAVQRGRGHAGAAAVPPPHPAHTPGWLGPVPAAASAQSAQQPAAAAAVVTTAPEGKAVSVFIMHAHKVLSLSEC